MPNRPGTQTRTVRISDDLWDRAKIVAEQTGDTLTAVINRHLQQYVEHPPKRHVANTLLPCQVCGKVVKRLGGGSTAAARHKVDGAWCSGGGA